MLFVHLLILGILAFYLFLTVTNLLVAHQSMDDKTAMTLKIPKKALLLDYASRAFDLAQQAVDGIGDADFYRVYECLHGETWHDGQIGPIISTWMTHDNRHLGMIECLIGIQGMHGTADS